MPDLLLRPPGLFNIEDIRLAPVVLVARIDVEHTLLLLDLLEDVAADSD